MYSLVSALSPRPSQFPVSQRDRSFWTKSSQSGVEPPGKCSSLPCAPDGGGGGPETKHHGRESWKDPNREAEAGEVRFIRDALRGLETDRGQRPSIWGAEGTFIQRELCGEAQGSGGILGLGGGRVYPRESGGSSRFPFYCRGRSCPSCAWAEGGSSATARLAGLGCWGFRPPPPPRPSWGPQARGKW